MQRVAPDCDNLARRANQFDFSEIVSSPGIKNISLHNSVNQNYKFPRPYPHEGRFAIVTMRWVLDAVDALASGAFWRRTKTPRRTAKSCGPGAATLALSFAGEFP